MRNGYSAWRLFAMALATMGLYTSMLSAVAQDAPTSGSGKHALTVGIFPRRNAKQTVTLFKPLIDHLGEQLGRPVELITAKDFPTFWEGVQTQRFDLVHYNQYHYVKSHAEQGYEAILSNEEFGEERISGAIYVRRDSGISSLGQLHGKEIIFGGDRSAMMSYIVPTDLLRSAGLLQGDYQEKFAISPPNSVFSVFFKQADAAGAGEVVYKLPSVARRIDTSELQLLAVSAPLPHLPWAARQGMDKELRRQIVELLGGLDASEAGRALLANAKLTAMHPISDAQYDIHRRIIARVLDEHY